MPISLEIVTPDQLLLSAPVEMVVIPASEGDMGVLEGHTPVIVTLRGGIVSIYRGDVIDQQFFVMGGFAEVTAERCTVLVNEAMALDDLRRDDAEARVRDAEAAYATAPNEDPDLYQLALDRVQAARAMMDAIDARSADGQGRRA